MPQSVPLWTLANVGTRSVLATTHAQNARLVFDTLVHILTGAVVGRKFEARVASTSIRAVIIDTSLLAQSGNLTALVHVRADEILRARFLEARLAVTPIRSDRIDAFRVVRTHHALVQIAFVYILAPVVSTQNVSRRTEASVSTAFVFAYLVGTALGFAVAAFVYVQAFSCIRIRCESIRTRQQILTAVGSVRIQTSLIRSAGVSRAFIDVDTGPEGIPLEPNTTRTHISIVFLIARLIHRWLMRGNPDSMRVIDRSCSCTRHYASGDSRNRRFGNLTYDRRIP